MGQVSADGAVEVDAPPPDADGAAPALRLLVAGSRHGILLLEAEVSRAASPPTPFSAARVPTPTSLSLRRPARCAPCPLWIPCPVL